MAVRFLNREISDLCLGKPPLRWSVSAAATVGEALSVLKKSGETYVSVWSCDHSSPNKVECRCVGKICMVDVICFFCKKENLGSFSEALETPLSEILPKGAPIVVHLEPSSSLLEAIDYILEGTQNLVIPIVTNWSVPRRTSINKSLPVNSTYHNGLQYCWLTQEDVVRFLLNSIGVFSPIPAFTIESLNIIDCNIMKVHYNDPASSALAFISCSLTEQTSVAVIDEDNRLLGEISPFTLACCDETVAAAITTLSAGDLMAYIDCGGPPDDLVHLVKTRLEEKNFGALVELMEEFSISSSLSSTSSCSSDDEPGSSRHSGSGRYSLARSSEAITCYCRSSLVAVMIQALAHRVSCIWVVEEDYSLVGIVTFKEILKVFRSISNGRRKSER